MDIISSLRDAARKKKEAEEAAKKAEETAAKATGDKDGESK